jgi:two-component system CheB/CheR fusion protein
MDALGIKAIKEQNGLVMVQEPSSAKFDSMPANAIRVRADIIAPVEKLPTKLINFLNFFPANKIQIEAKNISNEKIVASCSSINHDFRCTRKVL